MSVGMVLWVHSPGCAAVDDTKCILGVRYEAVLRNTTTDLPLEMIYDRFLSVQRNYSRPDGPAFKQVRQRSAAVRQARLAKLQEARTRHSAEEEEKHLYVTRVCV